MTYDRDLRRLRRGLVALLVLNASACGLQVYRAHWVDAFAGGVWTITCAVWLATVQAQQRARDYARVMEAGFRELKRRMGDDDE